MKKSAYDIIKQIAHEVEEVPPSRDIMLKEVQMMGFKIRQLTGDIGSIAKLHGEVIHSLWKIGKIDQIINSSFDDLQEDEQDKLMDYLRSVEVVAEEDIGKAMRLKPHSGKSQMLRLEVFKTFEDKVLH